MCFVVAKLLTGQNGPHQKESIQKKFPPHARTYFAGMIRLRHDNHTHLTNQFSQHSQVVLYGKAASSLDCRSVRPFGDELVA
jgi:hypothetical protein